MSPGSSSQFVGSQRSRKPLMLRSKPRGVRIVGRERRRIVVSRTSFRYWTKQDISQAPPLHSDLLAAVPVTIVSSQLVEHRDRADANAGPWRAQRPRVPDP